MKFVTKKIIMTILAIAFPCLKALSAENQKVIYLDYGIPEALNVEEHKAYVYINYPGPNLSRYCFLDLIALNSNNLRPIADFLAAIELQDAFAATERLVEIMSPRRARISMRVGTYVDGVSLTTHSGQSLNAVIKSQLGTNSFVVAYPNRCD